MIHPKRPILPAKKHDESRTGKQAPKWSGNFSMPLNEKDHAEDDDSPRSCSRGNFEIKRPKQRHNYLMLLEAGIDTKHLLLFFFLIYSLSIR